MPVLLPFIGPSYNLANRRHSVQRTINMVPVPLEPGNERSPWALKDVPGLVKVPEVVPCVENRLLWLRGGGDGSGGGGGGDPALKYRYISFTTVLPAGYTNTQLQELLARYPSLQSLGAAFAALYPTPAVICQQNPPFPPDPPIMGPQSYAVGAVIDGSGPVQSIWITRAVCGGAPTDYGSVEANVEDVYDSGTYNRTVTNSGSPAVTATTGNVAVGSASINFPGQSSGLSLQDMATTAYQLGSGDFAIRCFVRFAPHSGFNVLRIAQQADVTPVSGQWVFSLYTGDSVNGVGPAKLTWQSWPSAVTLRDGTARIQQNVWTKVEVRRTIGTLNLYVDDAVVASTANSDNLNSTVPLVVGAGPGTSEWMLGQVDEFEVIKGAVCP